MLRHEGPTLKRWRPRARGRATQFSNELVILRSLWADIHQRKLLRSARDEQRGRSGPSQQAAEARRQRVEKSRAAADQMKKMKERSWESC